MASLISHLSERERDRLAEDLNYMNLAEMKGFCRSHGIPFIIHFESSSGQRKKSRDTDRKSVVLARVRHYLTTGEVPDATCFPARVVAPGPVPQKLRPQDRLYYGWYDKTNADMVGLLRQLTNGQFRNGAIARILAREFWTSGEAPTFAEFADRWQQDAQKGLGVDRGEHPEAAWLTDRARGEAGSDWKAKRVHRARRALAVLNRIEKPEPRG